MNKNVCCNGCGNPVSQANYFLELLKRFVKEPWVDHIDEGNISLIDSGFTDNDFNENENAVIYKCGLKDSPLSFYALIEYLSVPDYTIPLRLLNDMVELLKHETDGNPRNAGDIPGCGFPAVVPIVVYDGERPWDVVPNFGRYQSGYDLFAGGGIVDFKYILININSPDGHESLTKTK